MFTCLSAACGLIAMFGLAALPGTAAAHPLMPESPCSEPVRPERSDVERWNQFVAQVNEYRGCIAAFVDAEYVAADAHRAAAERAGQRWNDFVRNNLNVPEDFPHIPTR
jgi:hypothetical protein